METNSRFLTSLYKESDYRQTHFLTLYLQACPKCGDHIIKVHFTGGMTSQQTMDVTDQGVISCVAGG